MINIFVVLLFSFPVTSHKNVEGRSNDGFPSLLLQLAKLGFRFFISKFRKFLGTQFQLETERWGY